MIQPLKEPKDYAEQIKHLRKEHQLLIVDDARAEIILRRVNYYRLSAYGIGLYKPENKEHFIDGISIEHLYSLYQFDCCLRNLILPVIEALEIELRAAISQHLAITYGPEAHKDPFIFQMKYTKAGKNIHALTMEKFDDAVIKGANMPCVKHHNQKYGGHFPIWAAVELFTFGMLSSLYSIMQPSDQDVIATLYRTKRGYLQGWLLALIEVRNICAHYGRIYNMPMAQQPYLYREYQPYSSNKVFPVLLTMKRMNSDKDLWARFHQGLIDLIRKHPEAKLEFMGFPPNWIRLLEVDRR